MGRRPSTTHSQAMSGSPRIAAPARTIIEVMATSAVAPSEDDMVRLSESVADVLMSRYHSTAIVDREGKIDVAVGEDAAGAFLVVEMTFKDGQPPESERVEVDLTATGISVPDTLTVNPDVRRTNV